MMKTRYYILYMTAPFIFLLVIMFTSSEVLERFHFVQDINGEQERFALNKKELDRFRNILVTSDRASRFSEFNWIINSKKVTHDYYLSFQKSKNKNIPAGSSTGDIPDFTISTGKERKNGYFGVPFKLFKPGKPEQVLQGISLRIDNYPVPWYLVLTVFGCAIMQAILLRAAFRISRKNPGNSIGLKPLAYTTAITTILLVFRLLFGYKAYVHYPFSSESYYLSLYALFLVPLFLFFCFILQATGFFEHLGNKIKNAVKDNYRLQFQLLLALFVIPVIFKFIIGIGREAIVIGKRFALSIFFVPYLVVAGAAILTFIFYWYLQIKNQQQVPVNDRRHSIHSFLLIMALFVVYILIAWKDIGFLLLYIPPFTIVCAISFSLLYIKGRGRSKLRALPVFISYAGLVLIFFFLFFPGKSMLLGYNLSKFKLSTGIEARQIGKRFTLQRTLSSIDSPLVLKDFSRTTWGQMEELDKVKQYLEFSKSKGGYFQVNIDRSLGTRPLHDYVTAVFLMAEFGSFWVIMVLLLFSCFAFIPVMLRRKLPMESKYGFSFLTLFTTGLTLFYSALYMIGSNLFLFPFSGKNVYLWGLDSGSDVVEAALLLGIFVIAYAQCGNIKRKKNKWSIK